ncbi:MAG: hypothetical protein HOO88_08585 [Kiritimatiellaceae bacterium]|nr:hypothetical protein [Kiritimatiellaceae bacterium]
MKIHVKKTAVITLTVAAFLLMTERAGAADGTWMNTVSGGLWSASNNWSGGVVADGSAFTADFSTIDITATHTIYLDSARTIGKLIFGDTATGTAGSWILDNNGTAANILTLAGGTPAITVNALGAGKSATISAKLAGSAGFVKDGSGTLILTTNSTCTGNIVIGNGVLNLSSGSSNFPTVLASTNITVESGGTLAITGGNMLGATMADNCQLNVQNGGTLQLDKILIAKYAQFDTGALVSGANLMYFNATNSTVSNLLTIGSVDFPGAGVILRPDGGAADPTQTLRFDGTGAGASINTLYLQAGVNTASTGIHNYIMDIADSAAAVNDLAVTTLNTAGNNTNGETRIITKQGAGTLRVSNDVGSSPGNFNLNVNEGTMIFGGTANFKSMAVGASGTLQFDNTDSFTVAGVISGSGAVIKSGAGMLTLTGTNTFTGATIINNGTLTGVTGGGSSSGAVFVAATSGNSATLNIVVTDTAKPWTCAGLTVTNAGGSSSLNFDFGTQVPDGTVAPLKVTGAATFTTPPTVTVELGGSVGPVGTRYPLMTWGSGNVAAPATVTLIKDGIIAAAHLTVSGSTLYLVMDAPLNHTLPARAFANAKDYGFTWWINDVRVSSNVWRIKTSRYAMSFAYRDLNLTTIFPLLVSVPESAALVESELQSFPASVPVSGSSCTLISSGVTNTLAACSTNAVNNAQFIEAGKFFQHRWDKIKTTAGPTGLNTNQSGVDICAWPDRVSMVYRVVPTNSISSGGLDYRLNLSALYSNRVTSGSAQGLMAANGSGYIVFKSAGSSSIAVNPTNAVITVHTDGGIWNAGEERSVGLIIYPVTNVAEAIAETDALENIPLGLTADQIAPVMEPNLAGYDADRGCYVINIKNYTGWDDNRFERTVITLTNATSSDQVVRLDFAKTNGLWPGAVGTVVILRDLNGNPVGIPVQLSKNWHHATEDRWIGPWFHGLTMLTVPANTALSFEADVVTQNYGGIPAASHAQLCLVGYAGNNQQWDEAAIGCWNESLCYDPNRNSIGTDSRPLHLLGINGETNRWTGGNFGGCDFLNYTNSAGVRQYHSRIRTQYKHYGPNLTDVIFAGKTADSSIEFTYSAGLYRSSDYTRGLHRIRYDVTANTGFKRMVFFQMGADSYNFNSGTNMAYGYGNQIAPVLQWTNINQTIPIQLTNSTPWFSTIDGFTAQKVDDGVTNYYRAANRGFIIRSWKARINGQDNVKPYFVSSGNCVNLVPPAGVSNLLAGDYVEAEIERVYLPKNAGDYYGSDANLVAAMASYDNTHSLVAREAIGNNLAVTVQAGTLTQTYPLAIGVTNDYAQFSVTGGIGYVPVTFSGLSAYQNPMLEERIGTDWAVVDQAVHGNDFWQTDYNSTNLSWEITYNLPLGSADYQDISDLRTNAVTRTFRFRSLSDVTTGPFELWINLFSGIPVVDRTAAADPDGDGRNNLEEFIAGTDPNVFDFSGSDLSGLTITNASAKILVNFTAHAATGNGYAGLTRWFDLLNSLNLAAGQWSGVSGYTGIAGGNQAVTHTNAAATNAAFYKLQIHLQ